MPVHCDPNANHIIVILICEGLLIDASYDGAPPGGHPEMMRLPHPPPVRKSFLCWLLSLVG